MMRAERRRAGGSSGPLRFSSTRDRCGAVLILGALGPLGCVPPMTSESTGSGALRLEQFGSTLPQDVKYRPFPAIPDPVRLAVLVGDPSGTGPFVVRVKVPAGAKIPPHSHPETRVYTVLSGVFYIGLGTTFDPDRMRAFPVGSVIVLPSGTPHFHWARSGEYLSQISAYGPLGVDYVDPTDDPRNSGRGR